MAIWKHITGFRVTLMIIAVGLGLLALRRPSGEVMAALPEDQVEFTVEIDSETYKLAHGMAYRVQSDGKWEVVERIFDPVEVARMWVTEGDQILRVTDDRTMKIPVRVPFADDFEGLPEGVSGLRRMIGPERGWSDLTLQSPQTATVPDYVKLRQRILTKEGDFLDARVEPLAVAARTGKMGLRCFCPAVSSEMICTKASLGTGLVYFKSGDTLWFQAWYRVVGPRYPHTLADFECSYAHMSPGPRICLGEEGYLEVELKALSKPRYQQPEGKRLRFPTGQWVCVTAEFQLDTQHGRVKLWQDRQLVLDATGPNFPFPSAIIDKMELGISAHSHGTDPATLDVDDVQISRTELALPPPE